MLWLFIFVIVGIIALYYVYPLLQKCMQDKMNAGQENWANYTTPYYNFKRTGTDPLIYYARPIYRKPYMYPFTFFKSYPYAHMSYYDLL